MIGMNSRFAKTHKKAKEQKMTEKLKFWKNLKNKQNKNQIVVLFSTQRPPDDWPDTLDHLAIGLVANKYTKLAKKWFFLLSQGLSYKKIELCGVTPKKNQMPNTTSKRFRPHCVLTQKKYSDETSADI